MAKSSDKTFTLTKSEIAKYKRSESKMTDAKRREISKALVKANSEANSIAKKR